MRIARKMQSGGLTAVLLAASALALAQTEPTHVLSRSKNGESQFVSDESAQKVWDISEGIRKLRLKFATLTLSASAAQVKPATNIISGKISLKSDEWFRVDGDKGRIVVFPIASGPATYEVEFQADRGTAPSQKDYDDSSASFSASKGLIVRTGKHLGIRLKIGVPAKQPVQVQLKTCLIEIGPLTGRIDAKLETGEIDYD